MVLTPKLNLGLSVSKVQEFRNVEKDMKAVHSSSYTSQIGRTKKCSEFNGDRPLFCRNSVLNTYLVPPIPAS